jgi:hypothetical protein
VLNYHGRTKRRKAQKRTAKDITNNQSQKAKGKVGEGLYCPGGDCPEEEETRGEFLTFSGSGSLECWTSSEDFLSFLI